MAEISPTLTPDQRPSSSSPENARPSISVSRRWERSIKRRSLVPELRREREQREKRHTLLELFKRMYHAVQAEHQRVRRQRTLAMAAIELSNKDEANAGGIRKVKRREMSKPWQRWFRRSAP